MSDKHVMNVVVLTSGKPHQRYVVNRLHARQPLTAVFTLEQRDALPGGSLKHRYWSARGLLRQLRAGDRAGLTASVLRFRLARREAKLAEDALREILGVAGDMPYAGDIPVVPMGTLNGEAAAKRIGAERPDLLVLLGCPMIKPPVLDVAGLGALNCHTSMLPHFRGAKPEHWILLTGQHEHAGATIHWATERLDAGDIALQRRVEVRPGDDPFRLRCRCMPVAADLLAEATEELAAGRRPSVPQPFDSPPRRMGDLTDAMRWACCCGRLPFAGALAPPVLKGAGA